MKKNYWDSLGGLLSEAEPENKVKSQVAIPQLEDSQATIEKNTNQLMLEIEDFVILVASYLQQNGLSEADLEIGKYLRQFEQDLSKKMVQSMLDVQASPMPPGTRFALPFGGTTVYIIENEPIVRSIYHSQEYDDDGVRLRNKNGTKTLAFPYMVFAIAVDKNGRPGHLFVGCTNKPLNSLDDPISRIHISNIYQGFNKMGVCDSMLSGAAKKGATVAEKINSVITQFWSSSWNGAGMTSVCNDKNVRSLNKWEANTKENPMFVLNVKWESAGVNVQQLAEGIAGAKLGETKQYAKLNMDFRKLGKELIDNVTRSLKTNLENELNSFRS